jgi:polyhydroxyalkanoate synthase
VFKIHFQADADTTFLLASGGHNAGIVADPSQNHRSYLVRAKAHDAPYVDPDAWLTLAERKQGSWWPQWAQWLNERSGASIPAKDIPDGLCDAPGTYVLQK